MKVKVTINQTFLLVELPNTQLMMVAVLECPSSLFYSIVLVLHVALVELDPVVHSECRCAVMEIWQGCCEKQGKV